MGVVLRTNAGNGLVYVAPQNGYELDEIHDVLITSATNGDFLVYESSTDLWKNKQITATDPVNYDAATQVISIDDASTSAKGAVQLTSLTNSTSEVLAATAKGLKDAYDVAAGAIPKSIIDNEGDLIVGASDDNPGKLGVGSNGYVLTVDTTVAGKIAWKAASGGAVNVTSPITNSGTSTNPIIGIDDASTTQKGAVQLSSSTDSTSEVLAATPLAVKTAYDQGSQGISDAATVASNLATHEADTTNVHGISDTANLVYTNNAGLVASATAPVTYSSNTIAINDATTAQKGAVQLSSLTNSTSEILAATPKAVKDAYDLANTANTTANAAVPQTRTISTTSPLAGGGALSGDLTLSVGAASTTTSGVVQLVNSTNSTSVTTAATPNSVKLAYDLAAAAAPATRTISTTAPLTGGGDLSANRTFAINSATTSAAGAVQLNATVTSTSQTLAATASAVKTAYDFADEIQTRVIMEAI
ncbi:MAG: tail fiber protein [Candidatus Nanopelagicaceae bacterium]